MAEFVQKLQDHISRTTRLERIVQRAEMEIGLLNDRKEIVVKEVSDAKGHLELKPEVLEALEEIQSKITAETVGSFEKLLTALVNDVYDPMIDIHMDLDIDHGEAALEVKYSPKGEPHYKSSVFENSGGITNIVCAGLRIIAVAKSGGRRFLLLDEPDCWLREADAPALYRVLQDLCVKFDYQMLVISHKPEDCFADARIIPLISDTPDLAVLSGAEESVFVADEEAPDGDQVDHDQVDSDLSASDGKADPTAKRPKKKGAKKQAAPATIVYNTKVGSSKRGASWNDLPKDRPGIRSVRLKNMTVYKDETLHLDPYLTVIYAKPDTGKSRITRAFRAALYGEVSESDIRFGETSMSLEFEFEGKNVLKFSRVIGRNPINEWELVDENGNNPTWEGLICKGGPKNKEKIPTWVQPSLGIIREKGLDLQISHQKRPVFLLDDRPSVQASVLSVGQEMHYLRDMQKRYKDKVREWNATVKSGESEFTTLTSRIDKVAKIIAFKEDVDHIGFGLSEVREAVDSLPRMAEYADRIDAASESIAKSEKIITIVRSQKVVVPELTSALKLSGMTDEIDRIDRSISSGNSTLKILEKLPQVPAIEGWEHTGRFYKGIEQQSAHIDKAEMTLKLLSVLPERPDLAGLSKSTSLVTRFDAVQNTIDRSCQILRVLVARENVMVPDIQKDLDQTKRISQYKDKLSVLDGEVSQAKLSLDDTFKRLEAAKHHYEKLAQECGGECPACHALLTEATLTGGKSPVRSGYVAEEVFAEGIQHLANDEIYSRGELLDNEADNEIRNANLKMSQNPLSSRGPTNSNRRKLALPSKSVPNEDLNINHQSTDDSYGYNP